MEIYKINSNNQRETVMEVTPSDESRLRKEIMGENSLVLKFSLPEYFDFPEGCECVYKGETYFLVKSAEFVKQHSRQYDYTLTMESSQALLENVKYKYFTPLRSGNNVVKADSPFDLQFTWTDTPERFLQLLVDNMNLYEGHNVWSYGEFVESEPVTLDFNHENCFTVLTRLAEAFETEWEVSNRRIHLRKVERTTLEKDEKGNEVAVPISINLSYGYDNGILGGISRTQFDSSRIINRVYIQGGQRNIDARHYGNKTLLFPKGRTGISYKGRTYRTDESGSYLERESPDPGAEDSLDLSKFYPGQAGYLTSDVVIDEVRDAFSFTDTDNEVDYSRLRMDGETVTVIFQTGKLAGQEFELEQNTKEVTGYDHKTRTFTLLRRHDEGNLTYPDGTITGEKGDKYMVFGISYYEEDANGNFTPLHFVTDAEQEALDEAVEYLYDNEDPKYTYKWQLDELYAKRNWDHVDFHTRLDLGYFVKFYDNQFMKEAVDIRITAITEYLTKPKSPVIEISNNVSGRSLGSVLSQIPPLWTANSNSNSRALRYARRTYQDTQEFLDALYDPSDHFLEGLVSALALDTLYLRVGDPTLQYQFVEPDTEKEVAQPFSYDPIGRTFSSDPTQIIHMTIENIVGEKAILTNASEGSTLPPFVRWEIAAKEPTAFEEADKHYYVYLLCNKTKDPSSGKLEGKFQLSDKKIGLEDQGGVYAFLVGIYSSERYGDRSFRKLYGYTEIVPGQMTIDQVISTDGKTYIDLTSGEIGGKIRFRSGNEEIKLEEKIEEMEEAIEEAGNSELEKWLQIAKNNETSIEGGLVLSSLIMLKEGNNVQSGMSGVLGDNLGFWTGGSYQQALTGEASTILRKDGSGLMAKDIINWDTQGNLDMGIFKVRDNKIVVEGNEVTGNIIITTDEVENAFSKASTIKDSPWEEYNYYDRSVSESEFVALSWKPDDFTSSNYTIKCQVQFRGNASVSVSGSMASASSSITLAPYLQYYSNGIMIGESQIPLTYIPGRGYQWINASASIVPGSNLPSDYDNNSEDVDITFTGTFDKTMEIRLVCKSYFAGLITGMGSATGYAWIRYDLDINAISTERETVIGTDGISVRLNSSNEFRITRKNDRIDVSIKGLPTSDGQIDSGSLYTNSDGQLMIKK